ncbi:hypothetical protein EPUL_006709, partial [Erysiphe pulchra]
NRTAAEIVNGKHAPQRYKELEIQAGIPRKFLKELTISRKILYCLLSAKSKHGDFKEYHEKFNHTTYTP